MFLLGDAKATYVRRNDDSGKEKAGAGTLTRNRNMAGSFVPARGRNRCCQNRRRFTWSFHLFLLEVVAAEKFAVPCRGSLNDRMRNHVWAVKLCLSAAGVVTIAAAARRRVRAEMKPEDWSAAGGNGGRSATQKEKS